MVRPAGFEPATYGFVVRCSIQLSQGRANIHVSSRPHGPGPLSEYTPNPEKSESSAPSFGGEAGIRTRVPGFPGNSLSRRVPSASSATSPHPSHPGRAPPRRRSSSRHGPGSAPAPPCLAQPRVAEGVGFEPTVPFSTGQRFSRPPPSTTRPSLLVQRAAERAHLRRCPPRLLPPAAGSSPPRSPACRAPCSWTLFERSALIVQLQQSFIIRQDTCLVQYSGGCDLGCAAEVRPSAGGMTTEPSACW